MKIFRLLEANEIECRLSRVNAGGVEILLYKDARVDQDILDEEVGPENWQRRYPNGPETCVVSIWDDARKVWVEKEDAGTESNVEARKGLASDSFKRACFNWGIGRELYTAPNIFIPKDGLKAFNPENKKCYDNFSVVAIDSEIGPHGKKRIKNVIIAVSQYGKVHHQYKFSNVFASASAEPGEIPEESKKAEEKKAEAKADDKSSVKTKVEDKDAASKKAPEKEQNPEEKSAVYSISDDTEILIGNCRGMKYGDAKSTDAFKSFLTWAKGSNSKYNDPAKDAQLQFFKELGKEAV